MAKSFSLASSPQFISMREYIRMSNKHLILVLSRVTYQVIWRTLTTRKSQLSIFFSEKKMSSSEFMTEIGMSKKRSMGIFQCFNPTKGGRPRKFLMRYTVKAMLGKEKSSTSRQFTFEIFGSYVAKHDIS